MPKPHTDPELEALQKKNDEYKHATQPCDIVLKGGAASGFVYAGVATELAKTFRLQSIGGTSAGAGAAGILAAAEYGRRSMRENPKAWGYAGIGHVGEWAGETTAGGWTRLRHLFGPDPETARLFQLVISLLSLRKRGLLNALRVAVTAYLPRALIALAVAATLASLALMTMGTPVRAVPLVPVVFLGAAAAVLFVAVLVALGIWADAKRLAGNGFAFCGAYSEPVEGAEEVEAGARPERMTGWLYGLCQQLAGKPLDQPLTFGDLWSTIDPRTKQGIRLSLMTVNLSLGRPVQVTCDHEHETLERDESYFFDPEEFSRLFPQAVVCALKKAAARMEGGGEGKRVPFPPMAEIPIIVGVRMSFALPILFSAVPLYKRDRTRVPLTPRAERSAADEPLEKCWFVDGAVCSNLPIHFFDKPLPRWPTFAVNLRDRHPDRDDSSDGSDARRAPAPLDVWIDHEFARDDGSRVPIREWWHRIDCKPLPRRPGACEPRPVLEQMRRFLKAALETLANWTDQEQLRLAASRDRVVHVCLDEDEGSFNFEMQPEEIRRLVELGNAAAGKLVKRFAGDFPGWPAHRGLRYVTAVQVAARYVRDFATGYRDAEHPDDIRSAVEEELRPAGLLGTGANGELTESHVGAIAQLTLAMKFEELRAPKPGDASWPDHAKLKPDFAVRLTPAT